MSVVLNDSCTTANHAGSVRSRGWPMAFRRSRVQLSFVALLAFLSACTIGPDTGPDPEVDAAPYPALTTVPPRPRLTYSIDQRREIATALVSDRANARYDREVARYELGLDDTPPPANPPTVIAEPEPPAGGVEVLPATPPEPLPPGGGAIAELAVRQQVLTERNNGQIESFLLILQRQLELNQQAEAAGIIVPPDPIQPETLPSPPPNLPVAAEPEALLKPAIPTPPTTAERANALDNFSSFLGGVFGTDEAAAPAAAPPVDPPAAAVAAPPTPQQSAAQTEPAPPVAAAEPSPAAVGPLALTFLPRSTEVPADAEPALRAAAQAARAENRRLVVEGHGASPALGLDRARSVASWLMRLGAPPDMVSLKGGGAGENVIVHLLPSDAA